MKLCFPNCKQGFAQDHAIEPNRKFVLVHMDAQVLILLSATSILSRVSVPFLPKFCLPSLYVGMKLEWLDR